MEKSNHWSRRQFIGTAAGAGVALMFKPFILLAKEGTGFKASDIVSRTMGVDTHNHMDVPFKKEDFSALKYDLTGEMKKSGLSAICMTFCVDRPELKKEGEAYERFITSLDEMDEMLKANNIQRALNFKDIKHAHNNSKLIVVQSVEGGHFIEGKLERLKTAYDRGLRHLGLMHDNQSAPPLGDIYTDPAKLGGLTEYGMNVIRECNKLGILVDLSHCSNDAIDDALAVATKPVLISHTGLNTQLGKNERMAKMMMPRLISKDQAKKVAGAGGVIGVWTHLSDDPMEYAQNIRAMADVVGIEHLCIGTDTKMATPVNSNERVGSKTNGAWQNQTDGFYYAVVDALLKAGFKEKEIGKIGGGNFWRIFDAATAGKS